MESATPALRAWQKSVFTVFVVVLMLVMPPVPPISSQVTGFQVSVPLAPSRRPEV
jgi:hypothetical protein